MDYLTEIGSELRLTEQKRRSANDRSWELNAALVRVVMAHEASMEPSSTNEDELVKEEESLDSLVKETVLSSAFYDNIVRDGLGDMKTESKAHPRAPRLDSLSLKMEEYARYKAFRHFLSEGNLLSPSAPCFVATEGDEQRAVVTDEEYLGGCILLCHDLAKYGVSRATNAATDPDAVPAVQKARDIVSKVLEMLLEFDFRNGPLRRKYDGTKYKLKTLETVLYELSVAGAGGGNKASSGETTEGGPLKKMKLEDKKGGDVDMTDYDASGTIPNDEIAAIKLRMDHRDALRERLIKACRDGQKSAKQSIFALHRGDTTRASKLLRDVETLYNNDLLTILKEEPSLRSGSLSGVLEEYVEGIMFYTWLHGEDNANGGSSKKPSCKILKPSELPLSVSSEEYLGGLCDLTGEVGRYAVARGTVRDKESVKLCLDTNKSIQNALKIMGKLPGSIGKKQTALIRSVENLERMIYELSLMEMTGREVVTAVEDSPEDIGGD